MFPSIEPLVERLWLPGREGLARHVPCLNRLSGKLGCLLVMYLGPVVSVLTARWIDSFGPHWCIATQAVMIFGAFLLVDVIGIWNRRRLQQRWGDRAYARAFLGLYLPGLFFGFIPGVFHVGLATGERLLPVAVALPAAVPFLLLAAFLARRVYFHFGVDRFLYVYTWFPDEGRLVDDAIFRHIRHPQYVSFGCLTAGLAIANGTIEAAVLASFVALFGLGRGIAEEMELARRLGEPYRRYRHEVPAMFPRPGRWPGFLKCLLTGE